MTKGNRGFGALLTEGLDSDDAAAPTPTGEGIVSSRSQSLARLAAGKVVADRTEFVDPARCRPWRLHNRDLDHLTEESCRDLIDSFLAAKKQRIPAVVRRVRGEPDIDYEIIAGVRRWWTVEWLRQHHHTEFEYLVTVQTLTDEEAFRVSDLENRARKDITDWERAQEYSRALAEFYDGSQKEMAEHLNVSTSWLSRMLDVARLPAPVVAAFPDRHLITVRIARDIKPLAGDARAGQKMMAEARQIEDERADQASPQSAAVIAKRLVKAARAPTTSASRGSRSEYRSVANRPMMTVTRAGRGGGMTIKVHGKSGADKNELMAAIDRLLAD